MNPKTFGENETKQLNEAKNVSRPNLEVGREYLIRAPGRCVLAVYTGMAEVGAGDLARELPRFCPTAWLRGAPDDQDWPIYAGPRARWKPVAAFGAIPGPR